MIPNVFVSSTIADLQHLRDAIRETILELGYNPIMSDYGDIGYLPTKSAEDSCYVTMPECQLAVLIIGKRYGSKSQSDLSVTHNEFRKAKEHGIPTIFIIDKEVWSFKRVYDANLENGTATKFPNMYSPKNTFSFIDEIMKSPTNNGVLPYDTATEAKTQLKRQIAQLFGNLLTSRFDPVKVQMADVLSEIKTLRHELLKDKGNEPIRYLRATRFILLDNEDTKDLRKLSEIIYGGLDAAIPILLKSSTFEEYIKQSGSTIEIVTGKDMVSSAQDEKDGLIFFSSRVLEPSFINSSKPLVFRKIAQWMYIGSRILKMNEVAKEIFYKIFDEFKKETTINKPT